jgi:hypothetical protein
MVKHFTGFHKLRTRAMLDITTEDVLLKKKENNKKWKKGSRNSPK